MSMKRINALANEALSYPHMVNYKPVLEEIRELSEEELAEQVLAQYYMEPTDLGEEDEEEETPEIEVEPAAEIFPKPGGRKSIAGKVDREFMKDKKVMRKKLKKGRMVRINAKTEVEAKEGETDEACIARIKLKYPNL